VTRSCSECGVTGTGAFLVETDDGTVLCEDCRGPGECERCGAETTATTLDGSYRCERCQATVRGRDSTRDADQHGLGRWSG